MDLNVQTTGGDSQTIQVSDAVFAAELKEGLIHQVVTAHMAAVPCRYQSPEKPFGSTRRWC